MTRSEFNDLILKISRKMYGYSYHMLKNQEEAEDAVQEIFIRMWKMNAELNHYNSLEALAMKMTRNYCIDLLRKNKRISENNLKVAQSYHTDEPSPHEQMENRETFNFILSILNKMPENYRELICLRDIEKQDKMKRLVLTGMLLWTVMSIMAQTNPIDEMFDKYSEREGFTSVYISGKMFGLLAGDGKTGTGERNLFSRLKSVRILSVEDSLKNGSINFYDELSRKLNLKAYEELMVVRDGKDNTRFLIKQNGDIITELLMISGGPGNNSLIHIRGDLDLKTISEISKNSGINEMKSLEDLEKTNPRK